MERDGWEELDRRGCDHRGRVDLVADASSVGVLYCTVRGYCTVL